MNKLSKRLKVLASFVNVNDSLVDVGCDHGYLSIYLKENNLCREVICSDINQNALNSAINNIEKNKLDIKCYLSDGIKSVDMNSINTIIISGMGTSTIIGILADKDELSKIDKIILQSNNNHEELRRYMNSIGYYLDKEEYTFDKGKWYVSMLFIKSNKTNNENELKYGFINKTYGKYLIDSYEEVLKKIPVNNEDYEKYNMKIKEIKVIIK